MFSAYALIFLPNDLQAQPVLKPKIENLGGQFSNFVRNISVSNPDRLPLEYQLPGEQTWRRLQDNSLIQAKVIGQLKVRTVPRENFVHSIQGAVSPGVYAPKEWTFNVAGPLAQMTRTRTVCVNQNDCHTVQLPSPDPRAETQVEAVGYETTEQLRIKVNQIGIARFENWLGTGFETTKPMFCAPMPYPGAIDQGLTGTDEFIPDFRAQFEAARASQWQDMSGITGSLITWCSERSGIGSKSINQALTYAEFINLVARRSSEAVGQLPAPDRAPYWTLASITNDAQLRANKAAYTYASSGRLLDNQTLYADNGPAKVMVANGDTSHGIALGQALVSQFGSSSGVRVFWPIERRQDTFKRIALFETARIQRSLEGLTVKLSRAGGRSFRVRLGYSDKTPMVDKTIDAPTLVYPIASMTEGTMVFESRVFFKGDIAPPPVAPFVPVSDNEVLIQLTAKLPAKIDIEVENIGPNVDVDLKAGHVSILAKLRFENAVNQQGEPALRVSLRPACQRITNRDGSFYDNCAIDLTGFQVTSDGGLYDSIATAAAGIQNAVRSMISYEATNSIVANLGKIDEGVLSLSSLLGEDRVASCGSGAACFSLQSLVPISNQPISFLSINTSPKRISEALLGYELTQLPVRFVKATACQTRCSEVVALKVEPKVTFATNGLFDSVIPYAKADDVLP